MAHEYINPDGLFKPGAYSHVVRAQGSTTVAIAGQVALDADGNLVGKDDFAAQAKQTYANVKTALAAGGATLDDVTKMTAFIVNYSPDVFPALIAARQEVLGANLPANTLIGVQALAAPEFLIEVEAVAIID